VVELFLSSLPSLQTLLIAGPLAVLYTALAAAIVGHLRVGRNVRAAYTRKIFHFSIFTMATLFHVVWRLPGVTVLGIVTTAVVIYAIRKGDGHPLYEALARPTDAPHRTLFIVVPLITTALGGVATNILFARFAYIGYLVCGWGDAVGEPVGSRWGRHVYRVPSLSGVRAKRSVEGSAAVFVVGSVAAMVGFTAAGRPPGEAVLAGTVCGLFGAAVEAVSHHGLDNFTTQVAAAFVAEVLLQ
jgi:phytol kinase